MKKIIPSIAGALFLGLVPSIPVGACTSGANDASITLDPVYYVDPSKTKADSTHLWNIVHLKVSNCGSGYFSPWTFYVFLPDGVKFDKTLNTYYTCKEPIGTEHDVVCQQLKEYRALIPPKTTRDLFLFSVKATNPTKRSTTMTTELIGLFVNYYPTTNNYVGANKADVNLANNRKSARMDVCSNGFCPLTLSIPYIIW